MTWIEVVSKDLDGCSIMHGHNEGRTDSNNSRRTTITNNRKPKSSYCKKKRRRIRSESLGETSIGCSGNNDHVIRTTFSNEQSTKVCSSNIPLNFPSFENSQKRKCSCSTTPDCTVTTNKETNVPSLNEMGNDDDGASSSIFHATDFSSCADRTGHKRNSKGCNQHVSPLSSSTSLSSVASTSSASSSWLLFLLVFSWNLSSTSSFCPPYCSCDDIALSVDCHSASNLVVVPIFLNPQIKFLSLSRSQIKDITMSLQFYSELQVLDISHNKLESLGQTNFESLRSLHLLNVSYNSIKTLESGVFTGLANVRVVDVSGNQLERLDPGVFSNLSHIKEIILDRNRLEALDFAMFRGLDTLEQISIKFNFIQVIEPSQSFSPAGIDTKSISFANNNDTNGSDTFLGSVDLNWTLKNVRYLDISSNQLTRVKNFGLVMFGALKELNLCCNYIHTLEEKAFLVSPPHGSTTGHLERVNLSQNRLGRVPTEALEKLSPTLRQLDLSSNRISGNISHNAFHGFRKLESLQLSDNPEILYIDPDALSQNSNLINFQADNLRSLTEISPSLLKNKTSLENFSLKNANITTLSPELFQSPVDLTGNPIDCGQCNLYKFVTENAPSSVYSSDSARMFDQEALVAGNSFNHENDLRSISNDDRVSGKSNFSSNSISHQSSSKRSSRTNQLYYVRCYTPNNLAGVMVKDLKDFHSDFQHCFHQLSLLSDPFQTMVICIAAGILSLIFLVLTIKLCCVCGVFRRLSSFCNQLKSRKEKQSDKLFFDSMTIALQRDLAPVAPPHNFNANVPNGKSILGEHSASQLLYCGNGTSIPLTATGGCIARGGTNAGGRSGTLGRNGNGNHQITMPMDYDECYQDEDDDGDDDDDDEVEQQQRHRNQLYAQPLERCYAPIEPPPPIPVSFPYQSQIQSLSRKQQQKHQQMLYPHHSPTMGYSPKKRYSQHTYQHSSPKHSKSQHHSHSSPPPPVILHYEYPDFPSMQRVKQVPSVLV